MPVYTVAIEVRKVYHVGIEAASEAHATNQGNAMQSTEVAEVGTLQNIETEVVEVDELLDS